MGFFLFIGLIFVVLVRIIGIAGDIAIILNVYVETELLEAFFIGLGFAVRNFFRFKYPFNPFKAFIKGTSLSWDDIAQIKKRRY